MTDKKFARNVLKLFSAKLVLKVTLPKLQKLHQKKDVPASVWNPIVNRHNTALAAHRAALRELSEI